MYSPYFQLETLIFQPTLRTSSLRVMRASSLFAVFCLESTDLFYTQLRPSPERRAKYQAYASPARSGEPRDSSYSTNLRIHS